MKITAIVGAMPGYDHSISSVCSIVYDTMLEIGEHVEVINLVEANLQYCNQGSPTPTLTAIINLINESDGVIFATTSNLFAPSGIMQTFLEYLSIPIYKNCLKNKNCMVIAVSHNQSVRITMDYLSTVINFLGGYDSVKIPLTSSITKSIDEENKSNIEKYTEDFYRYVKQGRKFYVATDSFTSTRNSNVAPAGGVFAKPPQKQNVNYRPNPYEQNSSNAPNVAIEPQQLENFKTTSVQQSSKPQKSFKRNETLSAYNSNIMDNFNSAQEDDISEITKALSSKLNTKSSQNTMSNAIPAQQVREPEYNYTENAMNSYEEPRQNKIFNEPLVKVPTENVTPRTLNTRQLTQNLTHYFQPHLSDGIVCVIQLHISGVEKFDGCIIIDGNNCNYKDGVQANPDVTILTTDDIWKQVIKGGVSTQRAFMTGQLKVRGNFVLLSKFDIMFKR